MGEQEEGSEIHDDMSYCTSTAQARRVAFARLQLKAAEEKLMSLTKNHDPSKDVDSSKKEKLIAFHTKQVARSKKAVRMSEVAYRMIQHEETKGTDVEFDPQLQADSDEGVSHNSQE